MRKLGIHGRLSTTVLTFCSFAYVATASAEIKINPYPDVASEPARVQAPVALKPMVRAPKASPVQKNIPATEFSEALEQAADIREQGATGFDIQAYYNRFEGAPVSVPQVMQPNSEPASLLPQDKVTTTTKASYDEVKYLEEIEKAKQDLQKIKGVTEAELKTQAMQIAALRAEKIELQRQAAQVEVLRTEKAAMLQEAAQVEALMNEVQTAQAEELRFEKAALEQEAAQVAALRAEKAELELQASQVDFLRAEKAALELQASQVEALMSENQSLAQKAAQVESLRVENASLGEQAAQVAALRAEKAALEQDAAQVAVLRVENASLEQEAAKIAALRAENVSLAQQAVELESMRQQGVSVEMQVAQAEVLQAERDLLASKLEKAQADFQTLSMQKQEERAGASRLRAEKELIARQLQLAQQDYQDTSALEMKVSALETENMALKQSFTEVEMEKQAVYETLANLEPTSGHPDRAFDAVVSQPSGLYARASSEPQQHVTSTFQSPQPQASAENMPYWTAPKGMRVQDVLGHWSRQQDVAFVWDTDNQFVIDDAFEIRGNYEDAVADLLAKYMGETKRPVGSLHIDPDNGKRVLVVQTFGKS